MAATIFDRSSYNEILKRLEKLHAQSKPKWGKMNNAQMLAHVTAQLRIAMADIPAPIELPGWMLGIVKFGGLNFPWIKGVLQAPKPMIMNDSASFEVEKEAFERWFTKMVSYPDTTQFKPHPLMGTLNYQEWGKLAYKHIDYHFKQFGV